MATAVEGSYLMMSGPTPPRNRDVQYRLKVQNAHLAFNIVRNLLKDKNMNGFHRTNRHYEMIFELVNEPGFKEAVATIEKATRYLVDNKEGEMEMLVGTLDITDSQLYTNFQHVANHLLAEDVRFGRISSLFFFTYMLSKRLHLAGRQKEIESVIDWLAVFLNEAISPWLIKNHGGEWVSILSPGGGAKYLK